MENTWEQIVKFWREMNPKHRRYAIITTLITLFVLLFYIYVINQPGYVLLYSGLYEEDMNSIAAKLEELKIRHKEEGRSIYIFLPPGRSVYAIRAELAKEGLPSGGNVAGLELFDQPDLMATDMTNRIQYQRALQGEITKSILALAPRIINDARVILSIPEDTIYLDEEQSASASVTLKLAPGKTLDEEQVRTIVNLVVSASGSKMKPENVTVTGNLQDFTAMLKEGGKLYGGTGRMLRTKFDYEREVEKKVREALEKVYGPRKVVVKVNAELDLDYLEINSELPLAKQDGNGYVVSRQEVYGGKGTPATNPKNGGLVEVTTNYQLGRQQEHRIVAPGKIKKLTASVWINGDLEEKSREQIIELVSASIGIDTARGDRVVVRGMEFAVSSEPPNNAGNADWSNLSAPVSKYTVPGLAALALLLLLIIILSRGKKYEKKDAARRVDVMAGEHADLYYGKHYSPEERRKFEIQKQIELAARRRPEAIAGLLKNWLSEE